MLIENLHIENFKSIKNLDLKTKRVNVFIGEPNSGKSNILEALGLISSNVLNNDNFKQVVRIKNLIDLFFDFNTSQDVSIVTNTYKFTLYARDNTNNNWYRGILYGSNENLGNQYMAIESYELSYDGEINSNVVVDTTNIFTYNFKRIDDFKSEILTHLNPPYGDNLAVLLVENTAIRKLVSELFKGKGLRLQLKPGEKDINIAKVVDDIFYSYPYLSTSETLQRIVFMTLAIETNKDSVLIMDEPESNTFPFYTKYIAERIALDESNQYFLTTHNPYLLINLIEKTKLEDLNIIITTMENYQTKVLPLSEDGFSKILDLGMDAFFNFDKLID